MVPFPLSHTPRRAEAFAFPDPTSSAPPTAPFSHPHPPLRWWKVVSIIQLTDFMSNRGFTFFMVCLYVFVFLLIVTVCISLWVAWSVSACYGDATTATDVITYVLSFNGAGIGCRRTVWPAR